MTQQIDINELNSLQDVEQLAAQQGVRFTKADYKNIRKAQEEARTQYQLERDAELASSSTFADRFMRFYPKLLGVIASAGNVLITFAQSVIVNIGVPLVLILLLIVEQQRVYHGIKLFETQSELASFAAISLVVLNLVLEFIAHHIEHTKRYEQERNKRWSLRIALQNLAYRLGISKNWTAQELSPASWSHGLLRIVTFTILALALAGSMSDVIAEQNGAWYIALRSILLESSLMEMMTWLGGLLFAAAAVLSAQGLSRYVAIRTVEIRSEMSGNDDDLSDVTDQAAATAAYAVLMKKMAKKGKVAVEVNPTPAFMETGTVPMSANGHHNGNGNHP